MKKKVIEYISRMQDGGAETLVKDYALLLNPNLFDVVVVIEDHKKNSANYRILKEHNVKMVEMYGTGLSCFIFKVLARLFGQRVPSLLFNKVLDEIKPDIVHIQLESLEMMKYSSHKLKNCKLFFTCNNLPELKIGDKRPRERDACKYLLEHNNLQIIALHEEMAKEINNKFNINSTIVIRNGVDFERFKNINKSKAEIRKQIGIPENAYVIGNVGRFHYQKNHELIIRIFNEVCKRDSNAFLLLIGDGKLIDEVRKQIISYNLNDKVLILSHRKDIPELLHAMDVFLFPSRYEGLGIVLIEAQVVGLPCVVSNMIPKEAYRSKKITEIGLDDSIDKWAESCLNPVGNIKQYGNLDDYDMKKEIKKIESYYLNN